MPTFIAKRIRFRNGERLSVLAVPGGLPVHEVTLYLDSFRTKGRSANTIHFVCNTLALLYRELERAKINLRDRLENGNFLTSPELARLASLAQMRMDDEEANAHIGSAKVIPINPRRLVFRIRAELQAHRPVEVSTQASRLRYIAGFLKFMVRYVAASLPQDLRINLEDQSAKALEILQAQIPPVSRRSKLDSRIGLSELEQARLVAVIDPKSAENPWARSFVRHRNRLIVILLLATGMRRGELLGLQIGDLNPREPKLRIIRRADAPEDLRRTQPNTKTHDREIEISPSIMRLLWDHINGERRAISLARKIPQIFVSDEGHALSTGSIDKLFIQLREACPGLPVRLTSHVMRHTWNERFSELSDKMGLSETAEQQVRNQYQGWSDNSKMAATYTRRHVAKKGNEISLKLQKLLDDKVDNRN